MKTAIPLEILELSSEQQLLIYNFLQEYGCLTLVSFLAILSLKQVLYNLYNKNKSFVNKQAKLF